MNVIDVIVVQMWVSVAEEQVYSFFNGGTVG